MNSDLYSINLIISTFNNPDALREILLRILSGSLLPESIHIADDGSGSQTREIIKSFQEKSRIKIFHHWHENAGFRKWKILNNSLAECNGDYIVFLDGDCLPHPDFIKDHRQLSQKGYFVQGRRCFVSEEMVKPLLMGDLTVAKLILRRKVYGLFKAFRFPIPLIKTNMDQRGLIGCNWASWRENLVEVNGFDEDYEGWGIGEDSAICTRLYNLGIYRKFVYGRSIVYHLNHKVVEKNHLPASNARLQETLSTSKIRCTNGLKKE